MVFSSLVFLFIFLPIVIGLYYTVGNKYRNYLLLIASLFFYAWGEPTYVILMIMSIFFNYIFGKNVSTESSKNNKIWLVISIIFNISILCLFKYTGFIIYNMNNILGLNIPIPNISLPLGISFFTFQALSYVIDVYRKDAPKQDNFINLALYISLFPQLVAGPIVRYQTVNEQIDTRVHSIEKFSTGISRFMIGLSKKVFLSNSLGMMADQIFSTHVPYLTVATTWLGIIAYSLQIFFDFSGYSDMAIGLGKMFGFDFLENFNYPYISKSAGEFWRRWHISLGTWFKDYIYIPLGGSRKGTVRTYINLFIVWFLTGVWHGASWTFIAWGLYFGLLISIEKAFLNKFLSKLPHIVGHIYLILAVLIGWVLFRADSFSYAFNYIKSMFGLNNLSLYDFTTLSYLNDYSYLIIIGIIFSTPAFKILIKKIKAKNVKLLENNIVYLAQGLGLSILLIILTINLVNSTYNPFLYFRF